MKSGKRVLVSIFATMIAAIVEKALNTYLDNKAKGKEK